MSPDANSRVKERCMICEGRGKAQDDRPCPYCAGSGVVFARTGRPKEIMLMTGDCKVPMKRKAA